MGFQPNRKFKKKYNRIFRKDPLAANTFLLLAELADEKGQVVLNGDESQVAERLQQLFFARFNDPREYAL